MISISPFITRIPRRLVDVTFVLLLLFTFCTSSTSRLPASVPEPDCTVFGATGGRPVSSIAARIVESGATFNAEQPVAGYFVIRIPMVARDTDLLGPVALAARVGDHIELLLAGRRAPPEPIRIDERAFVQRIDLASGVFTRGDADGDGDLTLSDSVQTLNRLFNGGAAFQCPDAADANDDGQVNVSDAVYTLRFLFLGGPQPPSPGIEECDVDPTEDSLGTCETASC